MDERLNLKNAIISMGLKLQERGLVAGTMGNVSASLPGADYFYITPSGMAYNDLTPDDIVGVDFEGRVVEGHRKPSIESLMHLRVLRSRPDVHAVIHTHSVFATAVAAARKPIPAILESIIVLGGTHVEVARFAPAGSPELAENAAKALGRSRVVLLANHGVIGVGVDLFTAFDTCEMVEHAAHVFILTQSLDGPAVLSEDMVARQLEFFRNRYGQK